MHIRTSFALVCLSLLAPLGAAQKKPLEHSVYDSWKSIRGTSFSHDGKWIVYVIAPQEGDSKVEVKSVGSDLAYTFYLGGNVQFSNDSKFIVATIVPALTDVKKATKDKVPAADMPKNSLLIINLATGDQTRIGRVTSFQMPAEDSGWITYRPEPPKPATPPIGGAATTTAPAAGQRGAGTGGARRGGAAGGARAGGAVTTSSPNGAPLVIRNLATGKEQRIENVGDATTSKDGKVLAYTIVSKDGKEDGVYWMDLATNAHKVASKGKAKVAKIALNDKTGTLAFLSDKSDAPVAPTPVDDPEAEPAPPAKAPVKKNSLALYVFEPKTAKTTKLVAEGTPGLPKGWIISDNSALSFSDKGSRVFFGTVPKPGEEKKDDTPDNEKVSVDIWNWQDKRIMPQQILQAAAEQRRSHQAIAFVETGKVLQLETQVMPTVTVSQRGDGDYALGSSDLDYRLQASWDNDYNDYFVIDMKTGQARKLLQKFESRIAFSPDAKYLSGYDPETKQYFVINPVSLKRTDFKIPTTLYNELEDTPSTPTPYGEAGWTKDDSRLLVYDAYDLWSIDPTGKNSPMSLTGSSGRLNTLRFRYVNTNPDPEARFVDLTKPILLSAFNIDSKAAGFYTLNCNDSHPRPTKLVMEDKLFTPPIVAKTGDVISYTRQDFVEYPDVWVAKSDFTEARKLSNANPQQAQYNWGSAELVSWVSGDGQRLQGILIKPENFSYGKKYPMITYFYERLSDTLHAYHAPAPSASTVNLSYFASNGYVMFVPDIPYKTGYPGESSMSAIVSGVLSIVNRGYIDPTKLGIQGQSWGGYEVAYLVTQTNLFNCACSGAAVADMFSAYGGIRYGTGILREGQYEHGQSRIGGSIWEKPLRYLENSPLFWLDKVQTPLLMMHNDKDGAVPFTQGIELFSGLRRLGKPAWMVSYNGEDHNLVERKNRKDWSVRLSQYFDHYLKGGPTPIWMSKGIPATLKGKTFGFEPDPDAGKG